MTKHKEGEFKEWLAENGVEALTTARVGAFRIYVLDRDHSVWEG